MNEKITYACQIILIALIVFNLLKAFLSKDKSNVWSPMTIISLTYTYYCLAPFWGGTIEKYQIDESMFSGYIFHLAALISYVFIMIGFQFSSKASFKSWNSLINGNNAGRYGLLLFFIGFIAYGSVRGFHLNFYLNEDSTRELALGGFVYYLIMMLDLFPIATGLILIRLKTNFRQWVFIIPLWFILVDLLVAGARWRVVVVVLVVLTLYHLYPKVKKVNLPVLVGILVVVFFLFSAMDRVRVRGSGISKAALKELKFEDIKEGPSENYSVYWFSIICMDQFHQSGERVYFEPIVTSILMPIPRFLAPWKPDASYLKKLDEEFAGGEGAAYLNFVESYYSFGWMGVILWALFLGWLARRFWDNYRNNPNSLGAILTLGVFSGFCYAYISRGYLPGSFTTFILAVCMPFWVIQLDKLISEKYV